MILLQTLESKIRLCLNVYEEGDQERHAISAQGSPHTWHIHTDSHTHIYRWKFKHSDTNARHRNTHIYTGM